MNRSSRLDSLIGDGEINAVVAWLLVLFIALATIASVLVGDLVWVPFSIAVILVVLVPPIAFRNPHVMLPWEVFVLVGLPVFGRAFATPGLISDIVTYIAVAAFALAVAVELDIFTSVGMTSWFAVLFVVIATMATAGLWALVQWASDLLLQTTLVLPAQPPLTDQQTQTALKALMWDFVAATVAGLLAGVVFVIYFRRFANAHIRLPDEVTEVLE